MEEEEEVEEVEYLDPPKVLGDILESLAGAIFVDSKMSLEAVWKIFKPLFKKKIGEITNPCCLFLELPPLLLSLPQRFLQRKDPNRTHPGAIQP